MVTQNNQSPICCEHANEVPVCCPCSSDCYCKQNTCWASVSLPLPNPNEDPVEMYEEAIAQLRDWLSGIYQPSKVNRALQIDYIDPKLLPFQVSESPVRKLYMRSKIWTMNTVYSITASMHVLNPPGYLGCGACSRKPRTGETWERGNDLADGDFCEATWQKILQGIVRYEAEEVRSEKWKETNVIH